MTTARKTRIDAGGLRARTSALLTLLNLHYAGVAVLALLNLYLGIQIAIAWQAATGQDASAIAHQTETLRGAEKAAKPLQGLDTKLLLATQDADDFYSRRLPFAYSQVLGELGAQAKKQGVKLIGVQYAQAPVLQGSAGALTAVRMDARMSGDYRSLVMLLNSLERDKLFFLISGVTLTGQQSGTVGLRLGLTTYLRPPAGREITQKAVLDSVPAKADGGAPR